MERDNFSYFGFESERLNGLPWGDILVFDNKIRDKCGEDYSMKEVISAQKTKQGCGTAIIVLLFMVSLTLVFLIGSTYMMI